MHSFLLNSDVLLHIYDYDIEIFSMQNAHTGNTCEGFKFILLEATFVCHIVFIYTSPNKYSQLKYVFSIDEVLWTNLTHYVTAVKRLVMEPSIGLQKSSYSC